MVELEGDIEDGVKFDLDCPLEVLSARVACATKLFEKNIFTKESMR